MICQGEKNTYKNYDVKRLEDNKENKNNKIWNVTLTAFYQLMSSFVYQHC